jgi:hypothetical protein
MKHTYHVITPFSRWQHFAKLATLLQAAHVWWHPVFDYDVPPIFSADWLRPHFCPIAPNGFFPGYWKTNYCLDQLVWDDEARYLVLNDDDWYEEGFFNKLDEHPGELVICSMKRGESLLKACQENMRVAYVGGEQLVVSGRLLKDHRYNGHYEADGELILKLASLHAVEFAPEAEVWFNHLT